MDGLIAFVNYLEPWHWAALGLVLLVAEVSTGTTFLLWPALAAGFTALVAWLGGVDGPTQLGLFAVLTLALTWLGARYVRGRWLQPAQDSKLNERGQQMIGQRGMAIDAFVNGEGAVKLGDTRWRALSADAIAAGDSVIVVSADGPTLTVSRA
ncbi:MAG: NfeD family protein [Alphaproteobacteria bacterium]|nr:NfeD family protein [Alphaproteobacteria bacterium]